jgi:hypothetical protein
VGDWSVTTWHDYTWHGWGSGPPPPPDEVVHIHTPFFLRGPMKRPQVKHVCTVYIGRRHWLPAVFRPDLALDGRGYLAGPSPIDWDVHERYPFVHIKLIFNDRISTGELYCMWAISRAIACMAHLAWAGLIASLPAP